MVQMSPMQAEYVKLAREFPHLVADNRGMAEQLGSRLGKPGLSAASVSSLKVALKHRGLLPDAGGASMSAGGASYVQPEPEEDEEEDDLIIGQRIEQSYDAFHRMIEWAVRGRIPSLIGSGPPGLGKSFGVTKAIDRLSRDEDELDAEDVKYRLVDSMYLDQMLQEDGAILEPRQTAASFFCVRPCKIVRGSITAAGLYMALWDTHENGLLVLDDCDDVFRNEEALNLLKGALESESRRRISYQKRASWLEELGIPMQFEYSGSVVFLTNLDFEREIAENRAGAKHFSALMDRSMYVGLGIKTKRDVMIRLEQVCPSMLRDRDFGDARIEELIAFVREHRDGFYTLSIRLIKQIADAMERSPDTWREDVLVSKTRSKWGRT